ncbi:MAG: hypothetical protein V7782_00975 [Psychromonas sp.]
MAKLFVEGNSEGDFSVEDPESLARILYSLWLGSTLMAAMQRDRKVLDNAMQTTLQLIK